MRKYRKKPVEIEAVQLHHYYDPRTAQLVSNFAEVAKICGGQVIYPGDGKPSLLIPTLEGEMRAALGDWVIRGVKGEFYPCKPEIFMLTYDLAGEVPF